MEKQFEVKEGAVVYVLDHYTYHKWFLKKIDKEPCYPLGYCLKTDDQYLKYYTMTWPENWKELIGKLYFLTEEDVKAHLESKNKTLKNNILNMTKEQLVNELYNGWLGENDRVHAEMEAMKDKLELEFEIRPVR